MSLSVIVYSPNEIRGRIILEALKAKGIHAQLFTSPFEAEESINEHSPPIIIFDAKKTVPSELRFLKKLSQYSPAIALSVLYDSANADVFENLGLKNLNLLPEPLDPTFVLSTVLDELASRKKFSIHKYYKILSRTFFWLMRFFIRGVILGTILAVGLAAGYIYWCISTLPKIEILDAYSPYEASKLYSYDNVLLTEFYVERRTFVPHEQIPDHVKQAFIAVEDRRFYKHHGIDIIRVIGALITNLRKGAFVQGASTITQQLAKMLFLKPEKTITRKIKEIALSFQIERKYTKDEILGLYVNQAYFGTRAYGIEAASQTYFGKPASEITIPEAALLAALPKAPSKYSPFEDPKKSRIRRNFVLQRMRSAGFISEAEYRDAKKDPIPTNFFGRKFKAPYFVDFCRRALEDKFGDRLYAAGLKIYTTLDYKIQEIAEAAVLKGIDEMKKRGVKGVQAALLVIEPDTGQIKAMVGGTDFWNSQFNRVTQAKRQPGSVFKPIVYLTALKQGFSPNDIILDSPIAYMRQDEEDTLTTQNYEETYYRTTTLNTALARSLNAATINLSKRVKMKNIIKTAVTLGIKSPIRPFESSALGASETTLMEMVYAYSALSNGTRVDPVFIDRIIDREELSIIEPTHQKKRVMNTRVLRDIRRMLKEVILTGTGAAAKVLNRDVYGKTGTTNDCADAWFIGFDNNLVAGVWVGRDSRTRIGKNETGARAALPIWIEFMKNM